MKWWRRVFRAAGGVRPGSAWSRSLGAAVAALVLVGLSVGAAVPSYAAVPVAASGSKTLLLAKAGIVSVPNQIGGMTGMVPSCGPCLAIPAAAGGVMEVLNAIGAAYTIQQVVEGIGKAFTIPGSLSTNGTPAQTVTVHGDVAGASATTDWTSVEGRVGVASNGAEATISSTLALYDGIGCLTSNSTGKLEISGGISNSGIDRIGVYYNGAGGGWRDGGYWTATPQDFGGGKKCPNTGAKFYATMDLGAFGQPLTQWAPTYNTAPAFRTGFAPPSSVTAALPGSMNSQLWCQNPQDKGGALVDYTIAQAMSLQKGQTVNLQPQTCPDPGQVAVDKKVSFVPTDTTKAPVPIVNPRGTDPTTYSQQKKTALQYPQCAAGGCTVDLRKVNGDPCGAIGQGCPDWVSDPNYATKYQCFYGGSQVDIGYCSMYRAPKSGVQPNVDGNGNMVPVTAPPLDDPGQTVKPGTAEPVPVDNNDPKGCAPSSVIEMLNPFALFGAITCAMQNMFVPDPVKIQTSVQGVQDSWSDTPFVKVSGMVSSVAASVPANQSGCNGISFTFPAVLGVQAQNFSVLNACTEPLAGVALMVRTIGSIGIIFAGIMALTKMAGGVINLPGMGKSGD